MDSTAGDKDQEIWRKSTENVKEDILLDRDR